MRSCSPCFMLLRPTARITLIEDTPYDEITHGTEFAGYMATTEQNAKATPALGQRDNLPVIDDYAPVKDLLQRAKTVDIPPMHRFLCPIVFTLQSHFTG